MSANRIASRYAKALFQLTSGKPEEAKVQFDALKVVEQLFHIDDSARVLRSPVMPTDLKRSLINFALDKVKAGDPLKHFFDALQSAGRLNLFPEVVKAYQLLLDEAQGVVHAEVLSAVELGAAEISAIQNALKELLNKKIEIAQKTDASLLGGFVVRIGNLLVDSSVKTKLNKLAQAAVG